VVDTGNIPSYPGMMPTNPGAAPHYGYGPAQHVPTGGGQVFAPPPSTTKKSSAGLVIALVVLALGGAAVAAVVFLQPTSVATNADAGIALPPTGAVVVHQDPTEPGGNRTTGTISTGTRVAINTPQGGGKTPAPPPTLSPAPPPTLSPTPPPTLSPTPPPTATDPKVDPNADEECKAAIRLAAGNNIGMAVNHFRSCDGPSKPQARSSIDQAAQRVAAAKGCASTRDVNLAAQIGASTALNMLRAQHCPGVR
jgi:hypothetical protein